MAAVRLLVNEARLAESQHDGFHVGHCARHSASGSGAVRPRLAISLNAPNDEIREAIMPITRKWKIEDVIQAAAQLPLRPRERVTFEYVLWAASTTGCNTRTNWLRWPECADACQGKPDRLESRPGIAYAMPEPERVAAFQQRLIARGVPAFLHRPLGRDIYAACGQ